MHGSSGLLALVFLASKKSALTHCPGCAARAHTGDPVVSHSSTRAQITHDTIIMITILLPLLFRVAASDKVPERHPYSYTYNVLDVPSNNNYQVT